MPTCLLDPRPHARPGAAVIDSTLLWAPDAVARSVVWAQTRHLRALGPRSRSAMLCSVALDRFVRCVMLCDITTKLGRPHEPFERLITRIQIRAQIVTRHAGEALDGQYPFGGNTLLAGNPIGNGALLESQGCGHGDLAACVVDSLLQGPERARLFGLM